MIDPQDLQRRKYVLESAQTHLNAANEELRQVSLREAAGRVSFFDRVALGAAATIAAVVSFVGAHNRKLEPSWLLRASLLSLALVIFSALLRNWRFPYYALTTNEVATFKARLDLARAKLSYSEIAPVRSMETGESLEETAWATDSERDCKQLEDLVDLKGSQAKTDWKIVACSGNAALLLAMFSMGLLITLAWRNF